MSAPSLPQGLLPPNFPWIDPRTGAPAQEVAQYFLQLDAILRKALQFGIGNLIEVGLGTPANAATLQLDPASGIKQTLINNVAGFTLTAPTTVGDMQLRIVNGATAGTPVFSGFSKQFTGDALDTTAGHQFVIFVWGWGAKTAYQIKALQ